MIPDKRFAQRLAFLIGTVAFFLTISYDISLPRIGLGLMGRRQQRHLSLDLGNGECKWVPAETPEGAGVIEFHKTLIAGYPSGDKRMVYMQMEALTGWSAIDSWDFYAKANHPFIKTNYPHLAGTWGWNNEADQVVLVLRDIRTSLIEYHDVVWDFNYATVEDPEFFNRTQIGALRNSILYASQPPVEVFYTWRDARVMDEIHWYGWFIDYWMEGGLRRDVLTNKITTHEHWDMLLESDAQHGRAALSYDLVVGPDTVVEPSYDNFCETDASLITAGCAPVAVISGEKLMDYKQGPAETAAIANVLLQDNRTGQYVITNEAWDCIWNETIVKKKGGPTVYDRPNANYDLNGGRAYSDRKFSAEMLTLMVLELTRLIAKYSGVDWNHKATANRLVELLTEHQASIEEELDEVNRGLRLLKAEDFLGPNERIRQRIRKLQDITGTVPDESPEVQAVLPHDNPEVQAAFDKRFDAEEKRILMDRRREQRRNQRRKERRLSSTETDGV